MYDERHSDSIFQQLLSPNVFSGILIDPRSPEENVRSLALNKTHLQHWESQHGRIPQGAFVILRSGWEDYYKFQDKFFGNFADEIKQTFPGV